ncbi:transporter [Salirhabdus salicampi]|uniref:transporter n=1 Tax=Salirhabdus salicampi TaxID=476102 RepID=UPI0020C364F3|nr:transporter [Salirhabdus salicampi]MCP8615478.1 transporter [Salirhabdus salicampi]
MNAQNFPQQPFDPFYQMFQPPTGVPYGPQQPMQLPSPPTGMPGQGLDFPGQFGSFEGGGPTIQAVDPESFYGCLRRITFVRLTNGSRFWFYPVFIGRRSVAGYRWSSRVQRWVYTGFDTELVESFQCY